ncbi:fructose-like phosphotransferase system subunit EIIA [Lactobacillus selangorensis]|uniref:Fructose-like phosphotransferase system subunit EIIA n=1 Tax=Lactobacillus selangorensis TaxID=81857 RepID=A0A0R2FNJ2_9LACO|nr:PTS fructose transporter subunit IIA [Lactobacillus selangorensis]KRN27925.1 fructose-like phosphotransferase system subunit EIIA [Lactobacillus selangorensis]KRN30604.1 fructose-like phosphotransferase system subunit EIIA [Lactobacillus selangorensis]
MTLFDKNHLIMNLDATNQDEVMGDLAQLAYDQGITTDKDQLKKDLLDREKESTTGFGNGVSIPHTKSDVVEEASVFFARGKNDVEWNSLDSKPVNTWVSLMIPTDQSDVHLKLLAQLSRQLMHQDFIDILKNGDEEQVYEAISNIVNV